MAAEKDTQQAPEDLTAQDGDVTTAEDVSAEAETETAETATEASEEQDPVAALQAALEQAERERDEAKEQALRAVADGQNARRRAEKDVENARKFALERFASDMLPVVDNMERALEAAGDREDLNDAAKAVLDGVDLTRKSLVDALQKNGVETVDPAGEPFDPERHQAMSAVENPDVEPNTVVAVMQKGYVLNGRLLRPAMVMVSKAAS